MLTACRGATVAALVLLTSAMPTAADEEHQMLTYTHLYSDANGVSHFKPEQLEFKAMGGPNVSPSLSMHALSGAQGATFLRLKQGAVEDWHVAPRTQFLIAVQGESEVTASDGKKLRLKPGDIMLMDDTAGKGHITTAVGAQDHVALVVPVTAGRPAK